MNIRGIQKFSLVDYPGKMSCVVFAGNCNCRCPYCHNPCLVFDPESQPHISEKQVFDFLETRAGKLDGVVISGGEATLRNGLIDFAAKIKKMGFLVKLDTNGSNPEKVKEAFERGLIDSLGVDYKAPAPLYNRIAGTKISEFSLKVQSIIKFAVENRIHIDVRTTVHKYLLSFDHLTEMRSELDLLGQKDWTLQQFHPVEVLDEGLLNEPTYSDFELISMARKLGENTRVRGLTGVLMD